MTIRQYFSFFFFRKIEFDIICKLSHKVAWNIKSYFLGKVRKISWNVVCWSYLLPSMQSVDELGSKIDDPYIWIPSWVWYLSVRCGITLFVTLVMLNKLRCHNHFQLSANHLAWFRLLIQIHKLNDKQCRSRSVDFLEANWSGSTVFAKAGLIRVQRTRVKNERLS